MRTEKFSSFEILYFYTNYLKQFTGHAQNWQLSLIHLVISYIDNIYSIISTFPCLYALNIKKGELVKIQRLYIELLTRCWYETMPA
jgi:hypothetical protein